MGIDKAKRLGREEDKKRELMGKVIHNDEPDISKNVID